MYPPAWGSNRRARQGSLLRTKLEPKMNGVARMAYGELARFYIREKR